MSDRTCALARALVTLAVLLAIVPAAHAAARPVSLSDARHAPSSLVYVQPSRSVALERQCPQGALWSDVSAYQWDGSALGGQRWNRLHDRTYWPASTGRVVFDGVRVFNGTTAPVLFAGWCER